LTARRAGRIDGPLSAPPSRRSGRPARRSRPADTSWCGPIRSRARDRCATFGLSAGGESIGLFQTVANGNALIDGFSFPSPGTDTAYGRTPDGGATLGILSAPSPGAAN
jgi:hypothetical protein